MNKLVISLAVGASALFVTAASAAPMTNGYSGAKVDSAVEQVHMVCYHGRCNRGAGRVVIQRQYGQRQYGETYNYAPRERYERRGYDEDRGGGIGFRAPGVSIGIGNDRY